MTAKNSLFKYTLLFIPWIITECISFSPLISYLIAWAGSFYIFFISYSGKIKPLPSDRPISAQLMRPIFLVQIIFAGYMSCTSIFYLFDIYGFENFQRINFSVDIERMKLVAQCQHYYCLGHGAFTSGMMLFMAYPIKQKVRVEPGRIFSLILFIAVVTYPLSLAFYKISGLSQFANQFSALSFIACTIALAFAIPKQNLKSLTICSFLYASNFYTALTSGFKEPIILSTLILGIFLYPSYKRVVLLTFIPILLFLFLILPTYASVFRQGAWTGNQSSEDATNEALNAALNKETVADQTTWGFLVGRLSEVEMFTQFVESTPKTIDFYGFKLFKQAAIAIIPRAIWPSKASTEEVVMQRVYDAKVVNANSTVSAKPAYIVDAYLSGGEIGIFICLFIYGAVTQLLSAKAEQLFGGYMLGTALIFSGLFQILWRGLSFEFILNAVVWSFITMLIIAKIMRIRGIIQPI